MTIEEQDIGSLVDAGAVVSDGDDCGGGCSAAL